jgi:type I site-specific restriction endonuclease
MPANLYHPMRCNWAKRVLFQAERIALVNQTSAPVFTVNLIIFLNDPRFE